MCKAIESVDKVVGLDGFKGCRWMIEALAVIGLLLVSRG